MAFAQQLLLLLPCLLSLAGYAAAQCWFEDRILQRGDLVPFPGDNCFSRVCRCESSDRCRMEVERKVVLLKVNVNAAKGKEVRKATDAKVKTLECKCVEDLKGSHEMNFFCATPHQPGRSVEANLIGCVDMHGQLRNPGQTVTIQTSRNETMQCDCDASGHYVNCVELEELRDSCRDAKGRRVSLGSSYDRTVSLRNRVFTLQCKCTKPDQETPCTLIDT